jgi:uncharacterized protein YbdZ (MbtH family)
MITPKQRRECMLQQVVDEERFPLWDQSANRPSGFKVTHLLGQDRLVPAWMKMRPEVTIGHIEQVSPDLIQVELLGLVHFEDELVLKIPVLCRLRTPRSIDERFAHPDRRDACIERLVRLKTMRHRQNLHKCLHVSVRRRRILEPRLVRSVPDFILVR